MLMLRQTAPVEYVGRWRRERRGACRLRRFGYVGLIGSATKQARLHSRLRQAGLEPDDIAKVDCPTGIDGVKSKHPAAIAVSVVADLLVRIEDLAVHTKQEDLAPGSVEPARV
ncbi:MAG: XdhC family protein, partial [Proteobacteria bacterium]|nr:XdhC family protein [Pseudomonadota bacterium]